MAQSKMISKPGKATSVQVAAHTRMKPVRNAEGPTRSTAQHDSEQIADNAFEGLVDDTKSKTAIVGGLAGCPPVNHLKAAIGLMNRRRA